MQFFTAAGDQPTVRGKSTAFFPAGAPPSTSAPDCLARCREWANLSSVKAVATSYRATLAVTRVTGTCYLRRQPLGPTQAIAVE